MIINLLKMIQVKIVFLKVWELCDKIRFAKKMEEHGSLVHRFNGSHNFGSWSFLMKKSRFILISLKALKQ